jgi:hypothetical protein
MPILLQNNKRLQGELATRDQKIDTMNSQISNLNKAFEKMEKHYTEANKAAVARARQELIGSLKQAREDNDVEAEQKILGQLDTVREQERDLAKPDNKTPPKKDEPYTEALSPEYLAWEKENTWFKPESADYDKKKANAYLYLAKDLRDDGNVSTGREFMDAVTDAYEERFGGGDSTPTPRAHSKVESSTNSGGSRGGKTFASLPADAKAACHADQDDLVGPDKKYKTLAEWEKKYAEIYYADGA